MTSTETPAPTITENIKLAMRIHGCLPEHSLPFPVKPMLQVQLYEAFVLIHVAFKSQSLLVGSEHSSMSEMEKIARVFGNL